MGIKQFDFDIQRIRFAGINGDGFGAAAGPRILRTRKLRGNEGRDGPDKGGVAGKPERPWASAGVPRLIDGFAGREQCHGENERRQ